MCRDGIGSAGIKVRWFSGSQPFDGILLSSGILVEQGLFPKRLTLEVTTSVHPNDHLVRKLIDTGSPVFGPKGIEQDMKTGQIVSKPHVFQNNERAMDLSNQILGSLKKKNTKHYPPDTILIIDCVAGLIDDTEWADAIGEVRSAELHRTFHEVFVWDLLRFRSATL